MIEIPLGPYEMKVAYNVNNGPDTVFWVPAADQNMRWAVHSVRCSICNTMLVNGAETSHVC